MGSGIAMCLKGFIIASLGIVSGVSKPLHFFLLCIPGTGILFFCCLDRVMVKEFYRILADTVFLAYVFRVPMNQGNQWKIKS